MIKQKVTFLPFNEIDKVKIELEKNDVSSVIFESIQGVGGLDQPDEEFINNLYKLCKKYDVCLTFIQHMDDRWFYFDINNWTINDLKNLNEKNLFKSNNINNHGFKKGLEYNEILMTLDDDLNNELYKNTSYIQTPIKRLIYFINEKK